MPLSGRHYTNPDDLLDSTTDTFLRWASEFDLIEMQVDEDGEVFFTPAGCEHDQEDAQPAPLPTKRPTSRRRLTMIAVPVMASMALAGTARAAYIIASPEVTYVAQSGETIHVRGGYARVVGGTAHVAGSTASPKTASTPKVTPRPTPSVLVVEAASKSPSRNTGTPTPSLGAKAKKQEVTGKVVPAATNVASTVVPSIVGKPNLPVTVPTTKETPIVVEIPGGVTVTLKPDLLSANSVTRMPVEGLKETISAAAPPVDAENLPPAAAAVTVP